MDVEGIRKELKMHICCIHPVRTLLDAKFVLTWASHGCQHGPRNGQETAHKTTLLKKHRKASKKVPTQTYLGKGTGSAV